MSLGRPKRAGNWLCSLEFGGPGGASVRRGINTLRVVPLEVFRMLDHVSLGVGDLDRSRRFYDAALRPLGLARIVDFGRGADYGAAPGSLASSLRSREYPAFKRRCRVLISASARSAAALSKSSTRRALAAGGRDDGALGCGPDITPTITVPSC